MKKKLSQKLQEQFDATEIRFVYKTPYSEQRLIEECKELELKAQRRKEVIDRVEAFKKLLTDDCKTKDIQVKYVIDTLREALKVQ